eukprot:CAMPEP_0204407744 /NCGR_PEP_ID=MMETSP0470-20130426/8968_1 /ASSEMBLY_ACC=CAM_ASM_000385 /TAXON_ID=2969 /ORGANISM="Oxyrrhis marina" /LENGTH=48 /DNA_ID= /DNA_START= /DNA_END= /DNA_ORIENTATION=
MPMDTELICTPSSVASALALQPISRGGKAQDAVPLQEGQLELPKIVQG